jgi:hypothetical protein
MLFVALDPAVLAVPNHATSQDEAEDIIGRIIYWANPALYRAILRPVTLGEILILLTEKNFFPSAPNIIALLDMWHLTRLLVGRHSPFDQFYA